MAYITAAALPVLPGQADRCRNFKQELEAHREEWERLNHESTFTGYHVIYQPSPMGDFAIHVFEIEDPSKVRQSFNDTPHDNWWLDWLRDIHGIDIRNMPAPPPPGENIFSWHA
jgi:hypothetical protein